MARASAAVGVTTGDDCNSATLPREMPAEERVSSAPGIAARARLKSCTHHSAT